MPGLDYLPEMTPDEILKLLARVKLNTAEFELLVTIGALSRLPSAAKLAAVANDLLRATELLEAEVLDSIGANETAPGNP
jgi:hypothetical protein